MKFKEKLLQGTLIKRYKRFFIDINYNNRVITGHCPNTGSMMGLLNEGNKVWFSKSDDTKRKLKYTLQIIEQDGKKIGINTHLTNKILLEALKNNRIKELEKNSVIKPEVKFGENTRFDFLITKKNYKAFIEVKNVTLSRKTGIAEFPDAVTSRGAKHINELIKASENGYEIYIAYIIQREDCKKFVISADIDPIYSKLLSKAVKKKLNILCYDCKFSLKGIKLNNKIKYII